MLTGAGISAESGVPTFREKGVSLTWKGMPFEQISSAAMVRDDLPEVWEWFDFRRNALKECKPNPAHEALMRWESRCSDFLLVTQNIDGLHKQAGSLRVIELHGNIQRSRCPKCGLKYEMPSEQIPHDPDICDLCDTHVRPDVVLFGEMLPQRYFETAAEHAKNCELFVSVGTSALVYPAAGLVEIARAGEAYCVEVNPEETALSRLFNECLRIDASAIAPLI